MHTKPTHVHADTLCMLPVPQLHRHRHQFQQYNHKFHWNRCSFFASLIHPALQLSLPLCSWKSHLLFHPVQQLVWVGEPFLCYSPFLLCTFSKFKLDLFYSFFWISLSCSFFPSFYSLSEQSWICSGLVSEKDRDNLQQLVDCQAAIPHYQILIWFYLSCA